MQNDDVDLTQPH